MDLVEAIWPIPGAVVAALVAAVVSFVVTVLAKDQKISEFRQAWIDGLRTDVSDLAGLSGAMNSVLNAKHLRGEDAESYVLGRHDDFARMDSLITKIRLRLNPDEHGEILGYLGEFHSGKPASKDHVEQAIEAVVVSAQTILKAEWNRVKRGEPAFKWLKRASLFFVFAIVFFGCLAAYRGSIIQGGRPSVMITPVPVETPKTIPSSGSPSSYSHSP